MGNAVTDIYDGAFIHFDLEIAIVAFVLIVVVIIRVLMSALESRRESEVVENNNGEKTFTHKVYHLKHEDIVHDKRHIDHVKNEKSTSPRPIRSVNFNKSTNIDFEKESNENIIQDKSGNSKAREVSKNDVTNPPKSGINKSSDNIRFESNDLLEEYKNKR